MASPMIAEFGEWMLGDRQLTPSTTAAYTSVVRQMVRYNGRDLNKDPTREEVIEFYMTLPVYRRAAFRCAWRIYVDFRAVHGAAIDTVTFPDGRAIRRTTTGLHPASEMIAKLVDLIDPTELASLRWTDVKVNKEEGIAKLNGYRLHIVPYDLVWKLGEWVYPATFPRIEVWLPLIPTAPLGKKPMSPIDLKRIAQAWRAVIN